MDNRDPRDYAPEYLKSRIDNLNEGVSSLATIVIEIMASIEKVTGSIEKLAEQVNAHKENNNGTA